VRLSITGMVGLAASLIFAVPVGVFAVSRLAAGETALGAVLLVVAVLMVALPQYVTTPGDVPGAVLGRLVGRAVETPEDDAEGDADRD
jgi:hypothetical protein